MSGPLPKLDCPRRPRMWLAFARPCTPDYVVLEPVIRLTDFTFTFNILDTNVAGDMSGSREMITDIKTLRL